MEVIIDSREHSADASSGYAVYGAGGKDSGYGIGTPYGAWRGK